MITDFTPIISFVGGTLIGAAAVLLMLYAGRLFGATGILAGILTPSDPHDRHWRLALLAGMVSGPVVVFAVTGKMPELTVVSSLPWTLIGGFIVGLGVTYGSGCTSGHGVCGLARLSRRSIAATGTFMLSTGITVYIVRHVFGGL